MSYFERLPLVASPLATVPVLEEGLRVRSFKLPLDEQSMVADSECVLNAMNLLAISRNEAAEHRFDRADLYAKQAMELLGISVHDFNVRRRERFFRSYGVDPMKSVPNYRRLPMEVPTRSADKPWNEFAGGLAGSKLATEVVEKTQCQRLTEALLKERRSRQHRRDHTSKRHGNSSARKDRSQELRSVAFDPLSLVSPGSTIIAERFRVFAHEWNSLNIDLWAWETLRGYKLEFGGSPPQLRQHNACVNTPSAVVREEVQKLLDKGAIESVDWQEEVWLSSIFCIPKKDGSYRPVINLKPLNQYIKHVHFEFESLDMLGI